MLAPTFFMCFMSKQMYHRFANRRRASIYFSDLCFKSNHSSIKFLENKTQLSAFLTLYIVFIQTSLFRQVKNSRPKILCHLEKRRENFKHFSEVAGNKLDPSSWPKPVTESRSIDLKKNYFIMTLHICPGSPLEHSYWLGTTTTNIYIKKCTFRFASLYLFRIDLFISGTDLLFSKTNKGFYYCFELCTHHNHTWGIGVWIDSSSDLEKWWVLF